ncbi:substrate-binding domain-containing protein [Oceanibacterium hippocampi]|uniref:ABC transporter periplasmic-binding protein YtfQ n=1 Tax=Oceanibacterium hippocampi TaxID=745714 RepID=A0A1Y5U031_9PROT|nr:substrate-binding domain-containing protein [Oceanibacterium hippocampi]SLN77843.1 ABC transporter periplasmic-binding protein YtfQ precursor [Oceanibacterium hippocampi]
MNLVRKLSKITIISCVTVGLGALINAGGLASSAHAEAKPKVYFSMGFVGNNWMTEAQNMITALADSDEYRKKIDFEIQSAGGNAQQQIQQIAGMVQAGARAVIIYPINEAALRQVISRGCKAGVDFFVINGSDGTCAHSIKIDGVSLGRDRMEWMAKELNGKGDVVVLTGIPGTTFSDETQRGVQEALEKNPGINVIATLNGEWSQQATRVRMQELLGTKSWDDIDGVVAAEACYTIYQMQIEAGRKPEQLVPCAAQDENGFRLAMLPKGTTEQSFGMRGFSTDSMIWVIPMSLKFTVDQIEGRGVEKTQIFKAGVVDNDTVKFCNTGSTDELQAGCNVFPAGLVPNDWQAGFWHPDLPQLDFQAVTTGKVAG